MRMLAVFVVGVVLGVGGTLVVHDAGAAPLGQRGLDRAYRACLHDMGGYSFGGPPSASDRAVCHREARDVVGRR